MRKKETTEEKILNAARNVFKKKGMMGARMQEIADAAGINKAMLHYYFRSKEKLFEKVLQETMEQALSSLARILNADIPLFEKIERYVFEYITIIAKNEYLPVFVISEANRQPQKLMKFAASLEERPDPRIFFRQVEHEIKKGNIRPIRPEHLIANMMAMSVFPFLIQPMLVKGFGFDKAYFDLLIEERKKAVPQFIINAIKK